ncbi:MAG: pgeF [Paenibacillaceae bacterium]|nr:pgeF [Paenibacillaceae bacterium]
MEPFIRLQEGEPELYIIDSWSRAFPGLTAGFTGRGGGVSQPPYASLNMGLHVGDRLEAVLENRRRAALGVGIPLSSWTFGEQVHDCKVQCVTSQEAGRGIHSREDAFQGKDAFITRERGVAMAGLFADCVPLYFLDPEHRAVGIAHAGWKGTVLQVAGETVRSMAMQFGTKTEAVRAVIGPSIGSCCYEVDNAIIATVQEKTGMSGEPYWTSSPSGKYMLNLQEINRQIMIKAGIMPHHIEITKLCTGCNLSRFFSHRKEGDLTGRMAAWIGWKEA